MKKGKRLSEQCLNQYKSPDKMLDNTSMISHISKTSSIRSKSKERTASNLKNSAKLLTLATKEQLIKKVAKQPLKLNKSGLIKCKSANHGQYFKK